MTDLTPEKIEALRKLEKAATPGPWFAEGPDRFGDYNIGPDASLAVGAAVANLRKPVTVTVAANANLIVAARDALPALLSAASDLDEALRLLRETIEPGSAIDYADWRKRRDALLSRHSGGTA